MSAAPVSPPAGTAAPAPTASSSNSARFVTGSLMHHVAVMASTGAIGLIAVFAVDLINLFYISLLGARPIAAAVGFAGVVNFFQMSICIGLTIGATAIVSKCIGAGNLSEARRLATSCMVATLIVTVAIGSGSALIIDRLLALLGAEGETARLASGFLGITVHTLPLLGVGMTCSALLRSVGDARRSMTVTLYAAVAMALLDPLLIFALKLDLTGAAYSLVISRVALLATGLYGVVKVHDLLGPFDSSAFSSDIRRLSGVAAPAVLSNLATPVGSAFVTHSIAQFGPEAVAGQATIERLSPVAFGLVYALTGAIGPILAQNLGAQQPARVIDALHCSARFMVGAVLVAWLVLALAQGPIVAAFSAEGQGATLIHAFCTWLAGGFLFIGALFVANASFNNLGRPLYATGFNWARATLGTIPFAWWGSHYGPVGVLAGQAAGALLFGLAALAVAFRVARQAAEAVIVADSRTRGQPLQPS